MTASCAPCQVTATELFILPDRLLIVSHLITTQPPTSPAMLLIKVVALRGMAALGRSLASSPVCVSGRSIGDSQLSLIFLFCSYSGCFSSPSPSTPYT